MSNGNATSLYPAAPNMADIIDDANTWVNTNVGVDPASILESAGDINTAVKQNTGIDLVEMGKKEVFPNAPTGGATASGASTTASNKPATSGAGGVPTWAWWAGGGVLVVGSIFWYAFKK